MQVAAKQNNVSLTTIYGGGNRHIQLAELKQYLQYNPKPDYAILINYPGGAEQSMSLLEQHKVKFITLEETIVGVERDEVGKPRQRFKYWLGEVFHDNFKAGEQLGKALLDEAINTQQTPHFVFATASKDHRRAYNKAYLRPCLKARRACIDQAIGLSII